MTHAPPPAQPDTVYAQSLAQPPTGEQASVTLPDPATQELGQTFCLSGNYLSLEYTLEPLRLPKHTLVGQMRDAEGFVEVPAWRLTGLIVNGCRIPAFSEHALTLRPARLDRPEP